METQSRTYPDLIVTLSNQAKESHLESGITRRVGARAIRMRFAGGQQAERAERERQKRLEQARIDRLLKSAAAFQQAGVIRKYVEAIRATQTDNSACSREALERWSQWALAEADRIDPVVGCRFLLAMRDE